VKNIEKLLVIIQELTIIPGLTVFVTLLWTYD